MNFAQLKRAVTRLVKAELENAWKGAGHPEDYKAIEFELEAARYNYERQCEAVELFLKARKVQQS